MLHLRRLFYGRLGQLSRVRAAIMTHMPAAVKHNDADVPVVDSTASIANQLADTSSWAEQLCANHAEEGRAHLYCGVAVHWGVRPLPHALTWLTVC